MDYLNDLSYLTKEATKKTLGSLKKNWPIIFTGIVYTILNILLFNIIFLIIRGPLAILSGIIVAIVSSALISNYLYLLSNIINYDRITFQDFKDGFGHFLWKIYGVLFIGYIGSLILSFFTPVLGGLSTLIDLAIFFGVAILLNPLPETIYQKHLSSWESVLYSIDFIQENWLNWLLPNIVFMILIYITSGRIVTDLFATHLSPANLLNPFSILWNLVGQLIFSFMMIYRGHLYKVLSTSTRRKRMFMRKF